MLRRLFFVCCALLFASCQTLAAKDNDFSLFARKNIAVLLGSSFSGVVEKSIPSASIKHYNTYADQVLALKNGNVSALCVDTPVGMQILKKNPDLVFYGKELATLPTAFVFNKKNTALEKEFSRELEQIKKEGLYSTLEKTWFGSNKALKLIDKTPLDNPKRVLRVAVDPEMAPLAYLDNNEIVGLEIDLVYRIAKKLGYAIKLTAGNFESLLPSIVSERADIAVGCINITQERAKQVLFSTPSYLAPIQLLVINDSLKKNPFDVFKGKNIGFLTGAIFDSLFTQRVADFNSHYFNTFVDQFAAFQNNGIDAFLIDEPIGRFLVNKFPQVDIFPHPVLQNPFAFVMNINNKTLQNEFSTVIKRYKQNGTLKALEDKWFATSTKHKKIVPPKIQNKRGTLKLVTNAELEPMSYWKDGQIIGYEIELATRIAAELGYELSVRDVKVDALLPSINSGQFDIAASCFSVTEERKKSVAFSEPHYNGGVIILVHRKDKTLPFRNFADKKIGILAGSIYDQLADEYLPRSKRVFYNSFSEAVNALEDETINAIIASEPVAKSFSHSHPTLGAFPVNLIHENYAFAFSRTNSVLCNAFDKVLARYEKSGYIGELLDNWFGTDEDLKEVKRVSNPSNKTLRLGVSGTMEPMMYFKDGELEGYEAALIYEIAAELGYNIEVKVFDFASLIPALERGEVDLVANCISVTPERQSRVLFTRPVYEGGVVLVGRLKDWSHLKAQPSSMFTTLKEGFVSTFVLEKRYQMIMRGIEVTLIVSLFSILFAIVLGAGICHMRRSPVAFLNQTARCYIRLLQGTPVLVLLLILYYVVFAKTGLSAVTVAVIAFGMNSAAYCAEMFRSGIDTVSNGQIEAAHALGFSRLETFRLITLPQAAQHVLPVLKGEVISTVKMTSILGYIAIQDLTRVGDLIRSRTYDAFFPLIVTAVIYFAIAYILTEVISHLEFKVNPRQRRHLT